MNSIILRGLIAATGAKAPYLTQVGVTLERKTPLGSISQFWPITAQVIPVLALAIIVEARLTIQRWNDDVPRWFRTLQGVLWAAPLILFWTIEPIAFQSLAGETIDGSWMTVTQTAIGLSLGILVLMPTIELLVRANARLVAGAGFQMSVATGRWSMLISSWKIKWRLRQERLNRNKRLPEIMSRIDHLEQAILTSGHPDCSDCQEMLTEIKSTRQNVSQALERVTEREQKLLRSQSRLQDIRTGIENAKKAILPILEHEITFGEPAETKENSSNEKIGKEDQAPGDGSGTQPQDQEVR